MDYEKDGKKGTYNPLYRMGCKPDEIEDILNWAIGDAVFEFEKLPIVQDVNVMRNILYSGVWQNYNRKIRYRIVTKG